MGNMKNVRGLLSPATRVLQQIYEPGEISSLVDPTLQSYGFSRAWLCETRSPVVPTLLDIGFSRP